MQTTLTASLPNQASTEVEPLLDAVQPALNTVQSSGLACYRLFDCRHPVLDVAHVIDEPVDLGINLAQMTQNKADHILGHRIQFP